MLEASERVGEGGRAGSPVHSGGRCRVAAAVGSVVGKGVAPVPRRLSILIVDDSAEDATLIADELTRAGINFEHIRVASDAELRESLTERAWDLVLSDYTIPGFGGLEALTLVRERVPELPFIVVTGTINEETAVECIKRGADDYVLKDRLARLPRAVLQALDRVDERRARRQLEEQIRQSQKMEAVGRLAGGVAHDLNNLLTVIFGGTDQIARAIGPESPATASLRLIEEAATHAKSLTNSLLAFCRQAPTDKRPLELVRLVEDSGRLLRRLLPEPVEVVNEAAAGPPRAVWVRADRTQIQQVMFNLAINAGDAMGRGGVLRIHIAPGRNALPPHLRRAAPASPPGATMAYLAMEDNGAGMTEEVRSRAFEPFFTTKPRGQGTGLGLSVVHGIVAEHGGAVVLDSAPGRGTRAIIALPSIPAPEQPEAGAAADAPRARPREQRSSTVLVVEEHAYVRGVIVSLLRSRGWSVLETGSPGDGTRPQAHIAGGVGLAVLDMDWAAESAAALSAVRGIPGQVPTVLITGADRPELSPPARPWEVHLRKPFTLATLERIVGEACAAAAGEG